MMNHAVINGFHLSDHLVGVLPNLSGLGFVWISILLVVVLSIFFRSTVALLVATMSLLASENISFVMASVFVLAINLGKALPVLRLSQKANVVAKKGALFHGMVHVITTFVLSFFIPETFTLISKTQFFFSDSASLNPLSYVAINHLFYNLVAVSLGTLLFIPVGKIVNRLVGDAEEKEKQQLVFIGNTSHMSPSLAIEQVYQEIKKLAATLETMLQQTRAYIVDEDEESGKRILKYEKITDNVQDEIYDFLDKVMEVSLTPLQGRQIRTLSKMADELEFIADACKSIVLCKKEILSLGGQIDGDFLSEFEKDFDYLISTYEFVFLEVTEQKDLKIE